MDRFDAMRVFTRIVERRSFTKVAENLGLPRSSVTDAVKGLEARLGVMLLQRTTRQVIPTLDGEAYYQRCVSLIADLEDAEGHSSAPSPRGSSGSTFTARKPDTSYCQACRAFGSDTPAFGCT
jgi:DNA-binding transcriptional LysR family regulator